MRESGRGGGNIFDQPVAMDSEVSLFDGCEHNFEFAFNASNFSDRVLRIEIVEDALEEFTSFNAENTISSNHESDDCMVHEKPDDESNALDVDSSSGDEAEHRSSSSQTAVLRVKSVYISSAILAAKSPFFYKLFSNGMRESDQRHATLQIHVSEEDAFMDLLSFIYSKKLSSTTVPALLDVLMAADKFEVASCIRHCSELLCNLPMTPETALLYLNLPFGVSMASAVQPLTDGAKKYLATRYNDITKFQDEIMHLPLVGIEAILCSDDLQVHHEDLVYDFVLKWVQSQYPNVEERRGIVGSLLARVVRFPYMSCRKLKKALTCTEFDHEFISKLVLEALFFKAETPHKQRVLASESSLNHRFVERAYIYLPVKAMEFELPRQQCIIYLDIKREACVKLFPSSRVYTQAFHLGGQGFFLSAHCNIDQQSSYQCFGLFLAMQDKGTSKLLAVDYEFAARMMPTGDFINKYKGQYTFSGGKAVGYRNLFAMDWMSFMAEDSPCFINGMLHLRAELTLKQR